MSTERFVVVGLARVRSPWFGDVAHWANTSQIPVEFLKCVSVAEVRARLAAGRPISALLIDGGAAGLDRDLIDAARRGRNMGVLLVTHDFGVAARMASSIVVMDGGQVVETGEAGAIFASPVHESAKALVAAHKKLCAPLAAEVAGI